MMQLPELKHLSSLTGLCKLHIASKLHRLPPPGFSSLSTLSLLRCAAHCATCLIVSASSMSVHGRPTGNVMWFPLGCRTHWLCNLKPMLHTLHAGHLAASLPQCLPRSSDFGCLRCRIHRTEGPCACLTPAATVQVS